MLSLSLSSEGLMWHYINSDYNIQYITGDFNLRERERECFATSSEKHGLVSYSSLLIKYKIEKPVWFGYCLASTLGQEFFVARLNKFSVEITVEIQSFSWFNCYWHADLAAIASLQFGITTSINTGTFHQNNAPALQGRAHPWNKCTLVMQHNVNCTRLMAYTLSSL